jgi:hypothetical protein
MTKADPDALFENISRFIDESNALIARGEFVQLAGLDEQVRLFCEQALQLTDAERAKYAEKLEKLLIALQHLGMALVESRNTVGEKIGEVPLHKKATIAYQKIEATAKKKRKEE